MQLVKQYISPNSKTNTFLTFMFSCSLFYRTIRITTTTATNTMWQKTAESQTIDIFYDKDISTTMHTEETTLHSQTKGMIYGFSVLLTTILLLGLTCFVLLIYILYLYYKKSKQVYYLSL